MVLLTQQRYAQNAWDNYRTQMRYAQEADEKAAMYLRWAEVSIRV